MRDNQRVGSIRVNIVSADLQSKGYEVFREDGLCSFDLVAHKNGELLRVEVKGSKCGGVPHTGSPIGSVSKSAKLDCRKFDVLASVEELTEGFRVQYNHSLAHKHTAASYALTGADVYSGHTTKKNISRAAEFYKETNGYRD
jgi:hypothetical protein